MNAIYIRVNKKRNEAKLSWDELATKAGIPVASWMTGISSYKAKDDELRKIAPVLNTTFEYLKYGK